MKLKTFVALIIDESGSMSSIKKETINNFNEQLQVLKQESNSPDAIAKKLLIGGQEYEGVETFVSIVKFNQNTNIIISLDNVNNISEITETDYSPDGGTALYDAIGYTIERFQSIPEMADPGSSALFIILTDGEENSSKHFSHKKVKSLIKDLDIDGKWTFTFMGTENALDQAVEIGISLGNTVAFDNTAKGMSTAANTMSIGLRSYYGARLSGETATDSFYSDEDNA